MVHPVVGTVTPKPAIVTTACDVVAVMTTKMGVIRMDLPTINSPATLTMIRHSVTSFATSVKRKTSSVVRHRVKIPSQFAAIRMKRAVMDGVSCTYWSPSSIYGDIWILSDKATGCPEDSTCDEREGFCNYEIVYFDYAVMCTIC